MINSPNGSLFMCGLFVYKMKAYFCASKQVSMWEKHPLKEILFMGRKTFFQMSDIGPQLTFTVNHLLKAVMCSKLYIFWHFQQKAQHNECKLFFNIFGTAA